MPLLRRRNADVAFRSLRVNPTYTVLLPVKRERGEVIEKTVRSVLGQTAKPRKVLILVDSEDAETAREACKVAEKFERVEVKVFRNGCKAEALNRAVRWVESEYVLLMDAGDLFADKSCVEKLLRKAVEKDAEAVHSKLVVEGCGWRKMLGLEFQLWSGWILEKVYRGMRTFPLSGTGTLVKREFLLRNPFPETLTEDAGLGVKVKNPTVASECKLIYNLPPKLKHHLKQRARWLAGYIQNVKIAENLSQKYFYASCVAVQLLTPISILLMPFTMLLVPYGYPWILIDFAASAWLLAYITLATLKLRTLRAALLPFWWVLSGLSAFIAPIYAKNGKWYHSPKT